MSSYRISAYGEMPSVGYEILARTYVSFRENHGKVGTTRSTSAVVGLNPAPPVYQILEQNLSATSEALNVGNMCNI